jgi:Regulator of chromosome condensation (RCC1) repeat/Putative Ig domain
MIDQILLARLRPALKRQRLRLLLALLGAWSVLAGVPARGNTVAAWGANGAGQCNVPAGLSGVVAVGAGGSHSLALREDGTVIAWGDNSSDQSNTPIGLVGAVSIAAGIWNSYALVPQRFTLRSPAGSPINTLAPRPIPGATYSAMGLPPGLSLHPQTALLSGTPTTGGFYQGTVTATLGAGAQSRTLPLSCFITPAPGTGLAAYEAWRGVQLGGVALAAPEQDADGDGLTNAVEFALGTPPNDPAVSSEPALAARQSIGRDAAGILTLTVEVPVTAREQVMCSVEFADSLTFPAAPALLTPELFPGATADQLRLRFTDYAGAGGPRRFGRLAITLP